MRSTSEPSEAYEERAEDMWRGDWEWRNDSVVGGESQKDISGSPRAVQDRGED